MWSELKLHKRICAIPGKDGFLTSNSHYEFIRLADLLHDRGVEDYEIFEVLGGAYRATIDHLETEKEA